MAMDKYLGEYMNKQRFLSFFFHIGVWLLTLTFLFGALVLSATIPNDKIKANMEQSALSYASKDAFEFTNGERWNAIADNYADAILLNVAWHMGKDSPIISVLDARYYDGESLGEHIGLYLALTENASPNVSYARYWHGMAAFIRWMHLFADVNTVKMVGVLSAIALLIGVLALLISRRHWDIALLFFISLIAVQFWNIRISMEYQSTFLLAFLFCILFLCCEKKAACRLTVLSAICGAATCFFDFLTTETITFLLPMMLTLAVRIKEKRSGSLQDSLRTVMTCGGYWLFAYVGTFVAKWTIASIITKQNVWSNALNSAAERIGAVGENGSDVFPKNILSSVTANFSALFGFKNRVEYGKTGVLLFLIIAVAFSLWYLFRRKVVEKGTIPIFLLGLIVPIRYFVLNNHSFLHNFFTYRALSAFVFSILVVLWFNIQIPIRKRGA